MVKIADIPVNILDGFSKWPDTSMIVAGLFVGFLTASVLSASWGLMFGCLGAGLGVLVVAWHVGRPK